MKLDKLPEDVRVLWDGFVVDLEALGRCSEARLIELEQALWALHRQKQVSAELEASELVVAGSTGQAKAHPLLAEERALRREVTERFDRLGLTVLPGPGFKVENGRVVRREERLKTNEAWMHGSTYGGPVG